MNTNNLNEVIDVVIENELQRLLRNLENSSKKVSVYKLQCKLSSKSIDVKTLYDLQTKVIVANYEYNDYCSEHEIFETKEHDD